jgi:hypothetical protein
VMDEFYVVELQDTNVILGSSGLFPSGDIRSTTRPWRWNLKKQMVGRWS